MKERIKEQGLDWEVDSAGTGAYHTGELPDPRSIAMARENGIDITDQRARKITAADLDEFDLILTMDHSNQRNVLALTRNEQQREKVKSILDFAEANKQDEVPDPYWDDNGFQLVFDLLDQATEGIIKKLA